MSQNIDNDNNEELKIKFFNTNKEFINDYLEDWESDILKNCILLQYKSGQQIIKSNTFVLNPDILNYITREEIETLTLKLNTRLPPNENEKFNNLISKTQFHSHEGHIIINGVMVQRKKTKKKPPISLLNISDYSIMEIEDYILVFHSDLNNGLGISINNIWRKDQIKLKKDFKRTIKI